MDTQATKPESVDTQNIHTSDQPVFRDTLKKLSEPLTQDQISRRPGGQNRSDGSKIQFDYTPWHTVADILDEKAPNWTHEIKSILPLGEFIAITVAITIDGVTREGVGTGRATDETGIKKAEHDALKRAAVKFGIARELYKKESNDIDRQASSYSNDFDINRPPRDAKATSQRDQATDNQLKKLHGDAKRLDINPEEDCERVLGCTTNELSKRGASWFIDWMKETYSSGSQPANNVTSIDRGNSPRESAEDKGARMGVTGCVEANEQGYGVTESFNGKPHVFQVSKVGETIICTCGAFKTAELRKEVGFQCEHIHAVRHFVRLREAQPV